jgi:hypothetical protein
MRNPITGGFRGVLLPTLACSLACGGAVVALAVTGVRELGASAAASAPPAAGRSAVPPPAAVVVRTPPAPMITDAPTATVWVVRPPVGQG